MSNKRQHERMIEFVINLTIIIVLCVAIVKWWPK